MGLPSFVLGMLLLQLSAHAANKPTDQTRNDKSGDNKGHHTGK